MQKANSKRNTTQAHCDRYREHIGNHVQNDLDLYFSLVATSDPLLSKDRLSLVKVSSRDPSWLEVKALYYARIQMEAQNLTQNIDITIVKDFVTTAINQRTNEPAVEEEVNNSPTVEDEENVPNDKDEENPLEDKGQSSNKDEEGAKSVDVQPLEIQLVDQIQHRPVHEIASTFLEYNGIDQSDNKSNRKFDTIGIQYLSDGVSKKGRQYDMSKQSSLQDSYGTLELEHKHTCSMYCGIPVTLQYLLAECDDDLKIISSLLGSLLKCNHILHGEVVKLPRRVTIYAPRLSRICGDIVLYENFSNYELRQLIDLRIAVDDFDVPPEMAFKLIPYPSSVNINYSVPNI